MQQYVTALIPKTLPEEHVQQMVADVFKQYPQFKMIALISTDKEQPALQVMDLPGAGPF